MSRHMNEGTHPAHPTLTHPSRPEISLSLPTSGKPLVVLPTLHPTPSILLAVPSASSPALLSSMAVTTSTTNTAITNLALLGYSAPKVLVVGIVLYHGSIEEGGRSVIYTCEITIPEKGIGLNALLGSQARTEEYLSISNPGLKSKQANGPTESVADKHVEEIIASLGKGDVATASTQLDKYLSNHKDQMDVKIVKKLVHAIFCTALPGLEKEGETESKKRGPYSPKMVSTLLKRRVVNDEMVRGGVVAAGLLPLEDWVSFTRMLQGVGS